MRKAHHRLRRPKTLSCLSIDHIERSVSPCEVHSATRIGVIIVRRTAAAPGQEQRGHAESGEQQERDGDQDADELHGCCGLLRVVMGAGGALGESWPDGPPTDALDATQYDAQDSF